MKENFCTNTGSTIEYNISTGSGIIKKCTLKSKIGLPILVSKTTVKYLLLVLYEKIYSTYTIM